ncbi:hypothetical protein DRQ15_10705, partial [candidate division KSB1 bacterium]
NARPGDIILLRGGVHNIDYEVWIKPEMGGADGKFLTIAAYPGEEAIFATPRRLIINASYIRIHGIYFQNNRVDVVRGGGMQQYIEIINNRFDGGPRYGAIEFSANKGLIEGNVILLSPTGRTTDHGIYILRSSDNVIRNNYINGPTGYCIQIYDERKSGDPADTVFTISNVLVEKNFISSSAERTGIVIAPGPQVRIENVVIRNNVITANNFHAILIRGPATKNIEIYNNTFYQNGRQGINVGDGSGTGISNVIIKNNIFEDSPNDNGKVYPSWYKIAHIQVGENVENVVLDNNLYWPESVPFYGITDTNAIFGDPLFVDTTNNNFHLQETSPAIDVGVDVGLPYSGAAPDLGAFEYGFPIKPSYDVSVVGIGNFSSAEVGQPFNMEVTIKNAGLDTLRGVVGWKATITDSNGVVVGNPVGVQPLDRLPPEFTATVPTIAETQWTPQKEGRYTVQVTVAYNGDENPQNDTLKVSFNVGGTSVLLVSFQAAVKNNTVQLTWRTTPEVHASGFEIECSSDGRQYQKIGFVKRQDTTQSYQFLDKTVKAGHYYYRLKLLRLDGSFEYSSPVEVTVRFPNQFNLEQNYPNPFNDSTIIGYTIPVPTGNSKAAVLNSSLKIYSLAGRLIRTLVAEENKAGSHKVVWDGKDDQGKPVASGVYIYKLNAGDFTLAKKLLLLR